MINKTRTYDLIGLDDYGLVHTESELSSVGTNPVHEYAIISEAKESHIKYDIIELNLN